jgi:hypothetical protein
VSDCLSWGRRVHILNVIDDLSRECLADVVQLETVCPKRFRQADYKEH